MDIKGKYFKLSKDEFDKYLNELKKSNNTISLLDGKYFFNYSNDIFNK